MNIEETIQSSISEAFGKLFDHGLPPAEVNLQPTRKDFPGSHTFVTFPYARITRKSPADTAEALGRYLKDNTAVVRDFNVAKGFLNLDITDAAWVATLRRMVTQPAEHARNGQQVTIEFSSPNTNKPLHLGHLRNNFLGYATAQILEAQGYAVVKTNIINDRGVHICKSMLAYQKFGQGETPASSGKKGDHLVGEYYVRFDQAYKEEVQTLVEQGTPEAEAKKAAPLMQEVQTMLQQWEQGDPAVVQLWKQMNGWVYAGFEATYQKIGITFDQVYYESDTYLLGKTVVEEGLQQGVFFRKDDGSVWIDLTDEGLDQKLVLRADGTSVYITQDLGTVELRFRD
ncbi:MAG: arginine--tRNA ligase, partial [Tunicatimonas sp.]